MLVWLSQVWPFTYLFWKKVKIEKPQPLVPEFEVPSNLVVGDFIYNPDFYATQATAAEILKRFNALVMFSKAIQDGDRAAPPQWWVRFMDGTEINAGMLAHFFALYPEEKFPGVAVRFGISLIGMERGDRNVNRS